MAMRDVDELRKKAEALTPAEQIELTEYLIAHVKREAQGTADLSSFTGILKLTLDPLRYQKEIRAEWR